MERQVYRPQAGCAYALRSHLDEWTVYNAKGMVIGHVNEQSDLVITASPKSMTQLTLMDLAVLPAIVTFCKLDLGQDF